MISMEEVNKTCHQIHKSQVLSSPDNQILLGYSQGGALALEFALSYFPQQYNRKIEKLILISSFRNHDCHLWNKLEILKKRNLLPNKILICHGGKDKMVPKSWAVDSYNNLKKYVDDTTFLLDKNGKHEPGKAVLQKTLDFMDS